jgi:putative restriction endonuclease
MESRVRAYVGITDYDWYRLLLSKEHSLEEVNFWQPGGSRQFRALEPGELFLFKLHSPRNFIVGGGIFAHSSILPVSMAWLSFGSSNGVESLKVMRDRTVQYRKVPVESREDFNVGCIILTQPFFFTEREWIPVPDDWKPNIVQGKRYEISVEPGANLYERVQANLTARQVLDAERYGTPTLVSPRLGQGSFRVLVTAAYDRRCAVTGEKVLPVLEAAHAKPYALGGHHAVSNGLLLRSDLHTLFDTSTTFKRNYEARPRQSARH